MHVPRCKQLGPLTCIMQDRFADWISGLLDSEDEDEQQMSAMVLCKLLSACVHATCVEDLTDGMLKPMTKAGSKSMVYWPPGMYICPPPSAIALR